MNKFIQIDDKQIDKLGKYEIPEAWWSRKYEYAFAKDFIKKGDIVLDAGTGIDHPFKFYLADNGCQVEAIDIDEEILNIKYKNINFKNIDMQNISNEYKSNYFDKIFCISSLEQNKNNLINIFNEFEKVLKNDGKIILTLNYPIITPEEIFNALDKVNLKYVDKFNYVTSDKDLVGYYQHLRIFTLVLEKKEKEIIPTETKPIKPLETK